MSTRTLWISPTDWVSGDTTLQISYPSAAHPATEITATAPGDLKWVFASLRLPAGILIKAVQVCYQLSHSRSFISQVRLEEMQAPDHALVRHDDPTDLLSTVPTCYVSRVGAYRPEGAVTLALRLNFANPDDKITLGSVGVEIETPQACEINVRSFGAVGDGSHDDTEAVEQAIEAILESEQIIIPGANRAQFVLGGSVLFPPGKYRMTRPVRIRKDNITLRGCGQSSSLIQYEGASDEPHVFVIQTGKHSVQFEDLAFSRGGIRFEQNVRNHNAVRRCAFVGTENYAVRTGRQMVSLEVHFCTFRSCKGGVFIEGPSSDLIRITHCNFLYGKAYDIHIGSTTVWVEHCDFEIRPYKYQDCADAYVFIYPRSSAEGGSGWGLLFNNRFGAEITTDKQPGDTGFDPEIHGGPPRYAIRVGNEASPAKGLYNYCNVIGNQFQSKNGRIDLYPRLAHIKLERNTSYWMVQANYFDAVSLEGAIIDEPNWQELARTHGVNVKAQSNAFLNNHVVTNRPIFSQGGIGWPMVDGDAQQNVWRKNSPQPQYIDSNAVSRDLSTWERTGPSIAIARNAESPSGMSGDAFTVTKSAVGSDNLNLATAEIGDGGPWCFSVWFKAGSIDTIRLAVRAVGDIFVTRQFESFTRPVGEWHLIYVVVGRLPAKARARCIIGLGGDNDADTITGDFFLWDPRFEKGSRPQSRWIHQPIAANPILPTDGEMWVHNDGAAKQIRVQIDGVIYKAELTPL